MRPFSRDCKKNISACCYHPLIDQNLLDYRICSSFHDNTGLVLELYATNKGDNQYFKVGAGRDAGIAYDGTDMIIDPALVGTGTIDIKIAPTTGGTADKHVPIDCTAYFTIQLNGVSYDVPCRATP